MRQSRYFRLLGALLVPLYATGAWIAPALSVCPMHGGPAALHTMAGMSGSEMPSPNMGDLDRSSSDTARSHDSQSESISAGSASAEDGVGHFAHSLHGTEPATTESQGPQPLSASMAMAGNSHPGSHTHGCDCLRSCSSANGPAIPSVQLAIVSPTVWNTNPIVEQSVGIAVVRFAHVLPFATAPPNTIA